MQPILRIFSIFWPQRVCECYFFQPLHFLLTTFELFHCVFGFIPCADIFRVFHAIEIYRAKTDILTCMRLIVIVVVAVVVWAAMHVCECMCGDNKFSFSVVKSISAVHDVKICGTCAVCWAMRDCSTIHKPNDSRREIKWGGGENAAKKCCQPNPNTKYLSLVLAFVSVCDLSNDTEK